MNDQNQNNPGGLPSQTTGTNGGMFTAPPPTPPVNDVSTSSNSTTDANAPWADLMKDLPKDNEVKSVESEVVEDNPFFRTPKVEESVSAVTIDAPPMVSESAEAPVITEPPVTPVITPNTFTSTLPEIKPEPVVASSQPAAVTSDIPENFNPVVDPIPDSIMQRAVPTMSPSSSDSVTPSWMTETVKPVEATLPPTEMIKEPMPVEIQPVASLPDTTLIKEPVMEPMPEIMAAVEPVTPVATEAVAMPEPVKAIDATMTQGPAFTAPVVKENPPVIPPAPAVVSTAVSDDEKDAKNHRVRDILLVLAVVVLGVLALALGVALATSVIP